MNVHNHRMYKELCIRTVSFGGQVGAHPPEGVDVDQHRQESRIRAVAFGRPETEIETWSTL